MPPTASAPATYGKIPAQGDFLRGNVVDPAAVEFTHWLEQGQEALHRAGATLPDLPVCFLHVGAQARSAVVGALLPSRDAVGRVFPLATFVPVEVGALARSYPRAPLAYSQFLGEVVRLARDAAQLPAAEVLARVRTLPLPGTAEWALADELADRLLEAPAGGLLSTLRTEEAGPAYGMKTFVDTCRVESREVPARARVVLDCPLAGEGPAPWLELSRRLLGWKQPPSFFWTEASPPRLLVSLGGPPPSLLVHLARPDPRSTLVWPLRTNQRAAGDAALQSLGPGRAAALQDDAGSIDSLFARITAEPAR